MRRLILAVSFVSLLLPVLSAAPIAYTITGTGSGALGGNSFTDQFFTITGAGDTDDVCENCSPFNTPGTFSAPVTMTVDITGQPLANVTFTAYFFNNTDVQVAGFNGNGGSDVFDFGNAAFGGWNMISALGPISVSLNYSNLIPTDQGDLIFGQTSNLSFSAGEAAGVPEPGSFLLVAVSGTVLAAFRARSKKLSAHD